MSVVAYESLPRSERLSILWKLFWRWVAVSIASALFGGVAGFLIAFGIFFAGHFLGQSIVTLRPLATLCAALGGIVVGLGFLYVLFRWILRCQLGSYAIRLVRADTNASSII